MLTDNVPLINSMKPIEIDPLSPQFIPGSFHPDTYVTRAASVQLQGQIVNSVVTAISPSTTPATILYVRKSAAPYGSCRHNNIAFGLSLSTPSFGTDPPVLVSQNFSMPTPAFAMPEYGDLRV